MFSDYCLVYKQFENSQKSELFIKTKLIYWKEKQNLYILSNK